MTAYLSKRGFAIRFETIGLSSAEECHPNSALMKPIISECRRFVVVRASPDSYVEGDLVSSRNLLGLPLKLTPLGATVIDVKTCLGCVLSQNRY